MDRARRLASGHLGTIRVGLSEIIAAHHFISEGLREFREAEPAVELDMRSMSSLQQIMAIKDGLLDAGIVYDVHVDDRDAPMLDLHRIGEGNTMVAVCEGHRLADRDAISLAELERESVLWPMRKSAPRYYERLMAACAEAGTAPRIIQECTTNSIMLSLVATGMGVGFVTATPPLSSLHKIRLIPISDLKVSFEVLLVCRARDNSAALQRFIAMFERRDRETGEDGHASDGHVPPLG
nr:LysR family substrate-binding domain-containing protein [Novosphingobium aquimarinum]